MIDEIYYELKLHGLVRGHADFSTEYLGRDERHFDYLRGTNSTASIDTLTRLAVRLSRAGNTLRLDERWAEKASSVEQLNKVVWAEIFRRGAGMSPRNGRAV